MAEGGWGELTMVQVPLPHQWAAEDEEGKDFFLNEPLELLFIEAV